MNHTSFPFGHFFPNGTDHQSPSEVAVVIPTILRPSLYRALDSVFKQEFSGAVQLLIGLDRSPEDMDELFQFLEKRPPNLSALVLHLPYSTASRNGGLHLASDGGSLRAALSLLANARYVAYLDDDNAWKPHHLSSLYQGIQGKAWAFSRRLLVREEDFLVLAVDQWDSLGPDRGRFKDSGGFVDPNCLMIDKIMLTNALGRWADSGTPEPGVTADRNFFEVLKAASYAEIPEATVLYGIRKSNILYQFIRSNIRF